MRRHLDPAVGFVDDVLCTAVEADAQSRTEGLGPVVRHVQPDAAQALVDDVEPEGHRLETACAT